MFVVVCCLLCFGLLFLLCVVRCRLSLRVDCGWLVFVLCDCVLFVVGSRDMCIVFFIGSCSSCFVFVRSDLLLEIVCLVLIIVWCGFLFDV